GFVSAGREVAALARTPGWTEAMLRAAKAPGPSEAAQLLAIRRGFLHAYLGALVLVLAARGVRHLLERRRSIRIAYPNGRVAVAPAGFTILDASRFAGLPHASVCGGRGRCSTCRVRVVRGLESLPPAKPSEIRVLQRVGAPPNVRLACQVRPTQDLSVTPLLPASSQAAHGFTQPSYLAGEERNIVVLFADLRSFTGMAEHKLPYDLVFILNSYFKVAGEAVARAGGIVDKFVGDGVMALFGVESGPEDGCRRAVAAASEIVNGVNHLSQLLAAELEEPLKIGIGIHSGPAVVGRMGYGAALHFTAIGDTVNVASRLQDLTKEYTCQLVISEQVAQQAGMNVASFARHELTVRNRREALTI